MAMAPIQTKISQITDYPTLSIIVPCLNGKKIVGKLIKSILVQNYPSNLEIIVVDNGSEDGTADYIKKNWPDVKIISLTKNMGSAPALKIASEAAGGKFILATNDDVVFDKNALQSLVDCYLSDKNIGIVTGMMLSMKKPYKFCIPGFKINHYLGYHPYDLYHKDKIRECDWAVGACLLIKKSILKKVNGFDQGYIFCGEEYDLSFQIRRLGLKVMYTPKAIFYHQFRRNANPSSETLFAHYRGKIRYLIKNGRIDHMVVFFTAQIIFVPFLYLFQRKWPNIITIYAALFWNLKNLPKTILARYNRI